MAISSIGVGSGLPLDQLLADLRKSENQALNLIQSRQVQAENRLSAYGTLKGVLDALKSAADKLTDADTYGALKTAVSGDAFTASATSAAIPGEYSIRVDQLASSQTLITQGVADRTAANGTGGVITFTLSDGQTKTLDLSDADTSLNGIISAINADKSLGFNATLINDGDSSTPYRLLLTATDTGAAAAASSISVSGNNTLNDLLGFDSNPDSNHNMTEQAASNARVYINGIEILSQNNTIENAIEGVTLTFETTTSDAKKLSVTTDNSVTSAAIKQFVTAYNAVQTTITSLTSYDVENQKSSALTGDSLARRMQNEIRQAINIMVSDGSLHSLSQLGITTNVRDGTLELDEKTLEDALKNNMTDVRTLLSGTDQLSGRLINAVDTFNRSGGLISTTTDNITKHINDLQQQYQVTSDRIDTKMETYRQQFTALDSMVAQMGSISSYLTQQLAMLANTGNEK